VLNNSAFKRLRERHGEQFEAFCESKITCVPGDLTRDRLGLEEAAYTELIHKIDAVLSERWKAADRNGNSRFLASCYHARVAP
jgi:thioester reductase-like protein